MALKVYTFGDRDYQFEEGTEPKGAVLVKQAPAPKNKARKPAEDKADSDAADETVDETADETAPDADPETAPETK